jgi:hypothetical protein
VAEVGYRQSGCFSACHCWFSLRQDTLAPLRDDRDILRGDTSPSCRQSNDPITDHHLHQLLFQPVLVRSQPPLPASDRTRYDSRRPECQGQMQRGIGYRLLLRGGAHPLATHERRCRPATVRGF